MHRVPVIRLMLALVVAALLAGPTAPAPPATALTSMAGAPKGANDWTCTPTAAHPRPVVLVHGLGAAGAKPIDCTRIPE